MSQTHETLQTPIDSWYFGKPEMIISDAYSEVKPFYPYRFDSVKIRLPKNIKTIGLRKVSRRRCAGIQHHVSLIGVGGFFPLTGYVETSPRTPHRRREWVELRTGVAERWHSPRHLGPRATPPGGGSGFRESACVRPPPPGSGARESREKHRIPNLFDFH